VRILVTGATGLVGRQTLAPLIAAGHAVHGLSRQAGDHDGVRWHDVDLLDPAARARAVSSIRAEALLHLAWHTDVATVYDDEANERWLDASIDLLDRFRGAGGARAVIAGSAAEYDWGPDGAGAGPCRETGTALAPATRYGRAKAALHRRLATSAPGLSWAWARLFHLYGPGEDRRRLVPSIAQALIEGRPALCTAGTQERDFMDARDAGAALAALVGAPAEGPINIATGRAVAVAEIAETLGRIAGRPDLIRLGALPQRPGDPPFLVADTDRLTRELRFRPRHDLSDGLAHCWNWWKDARKRPGATSSLP
jgi:nucleoside-diphosphate-sugar epimerase